MTTRPASPQVPILYTAPMLRRTRRLPLLLLLLATASVAACARPLLSPADERSPFDRFDALRAQRAPQYVEDEFGMQKPNLRGRLGQKD